MPLDPEFLDTAALAATRHPGSQVMLCPRPGDPMGIGPFGSFAEWQQFVLQFDLPAAIPQIVTRKFERALKLYVLAWIDIDLMNVGCLVALTTLELALKDRYGDKVPKSDLSLARLVQYMVEDDGLADELLPMAANNDWAIVAALYETDDARKKRKGTGVMPPLTIAEIRNMAAHGYPFDGLPRGGLLELVRDLILYAYRDMIAELYALGGLGA